MIITRTATTASKRGPADYFTGVVWIDELSTPPGGGTVRAARVTFEPGARTAWHTHPHGQTLHILSGLGRVQKDGAPVQEVRPGDSVWFEPGERHWHGAAPGNMLVHLALQQADAAGSAAHWLEQVTDAEYGAAPA